jgi:hypothetical protein
MNEYEQAKEDYKKACELNLIKIDRWGEGRDHHQMSERIVRFLVEHDFNDYNDYFCWKVGGDGDNGETLMYQLDAFFEMIDKISGNIVQQPLCGSADVPPKSCMRSGDCAFERVEGRCLGKDCGVYDPA